MREAAVVGVPDEARGEIVAAFVVLRDGLHRSDELARELQEHVKAETAPYKYPRRSSFVDELPKTTSGKIHRAALRQSPSSSSMTIATASSSLLPTTASAAAFAAGCALATA